MDKIAIISDIHGNITALNAVLEDINNRKINKILLIATGALMNATSSQQGESIPGIAHAIAIEN